MTLPDANETGVWLAQVFVTFVYELFPTFLMWSLCFPLAAAVGTGLGTTITERMQEALRRRWGLPRKDWHRDD